MEYTNSITLFYNHSWEHTNTKPHKSPQSEAATTIDESVPKRAKQVVERERGEGGLGR